MKVEPLLKVFVQSFPNVPPHRRTHLYTTILKTLEIKHLANLLVLLFTQQADSQNQDESATKTNITPFCHDLCNEFDPARVVDSFSDLLSLTLKLPSNEADITKSSQAEFYDTR
jgi:hypothetical protein